MLTDMEAESYTIRDVATNSVVYSGECPEAKHWSMSGEKVQFVDFTNFKTAGSYYLQIGSNRSYPFVIGDDGILDSLSVWSLKAFYLWRCSCPIEKKYATFNNTSYAREEGHPDTVVYVHKSAASELRHVESEISASKGWYDAGDYNKYVVNAGFSAAFFMMAYELYPNYYDSLNTNIPESDNSVADILDELKWELDWLLNMQDPYDGGVYFKLTNLRYSGMVEPGKDKQERYVVGKSTSSALNFASTMAFASRIYSSIDSVYSKKLLSASEKAYAWAKIKPNVSFSNPKDVFTGEYSDSTFDDEFFYANVELFLTTKDVKYFDQLNLNQLFESPLWHKQNTFGLMDLVINIDRLPDYVDKNFIKVKFRSLADNVYKQYYYSVGKLPLKKFEWGSNGCVATNGVILAIAHKFFGDNKYLYGATAALDYLLGRNSVDYCFVSMFGSLYPKHIHDRRSYSDDIYDPLPGYLCGGPNKDQLTDCGQSNYPSSNYPARAYLDEMCSYSTNEIAINWNAPLMMLVGAVINQTKEGKK